MYSLWDLVICIKLLRKACVFLFQSMDGEFYHFWKALYHSQDRHDEESLTLMTTLSTQEACSGGQLKVEKQFFSSSFSLKGNKR